MRFGVRAACYTRCFVAGTAPRKHRLLTSLLVGLASTMGIAVLLLLLTFSFPLETLFFRQALLQRRNGCSVVDAARAVVYEARQRKAFASLRARSRVLRTDPAGLELWSTPAGEYWAPAGNVGHLFVLAELQTEPYNNELASVKRGDVVIDCGAYLGHFTSAALAAGAARVIAVEPGSKQVSCLRRTFAAEIAEGKVTVVTEGVWDSEGQLEFRDDGTPDARFTAANPNGGKADITAAVPVTTIDAIVRRLGLTAVDFIKMDIEGAEQHALRGAAQTLARFKPRLAIAAYHKSEDPAGIPKVTRAANPGYRMVSEGCRLDVGEIRPLTFFFY